MSPARRIFIILIITLPVILVVFLSFTHIRRQAKEKVYNERSNIAMLSARVLKEKFDRLKDLGVSLVSRPLIYKNADAGKWDEAVATLQRVQHEFDYIDRILLTDTNAVLKADLPHVQEVVNQDFSFRDWYTGLQKNRGKPYLSEIYRRTAPPRNIVTALSVWIRNDSGVPVGILVLQVQVQKLLEWSSEVDIGDKGFVYITDHYGKIAASPLYSNMDTIVDYSMVPGVQKALRGEQSTEILYNPVEKESRLVSYRQIPGYNWAVVVQQRESEAFLSAGNFNTLYGVYAISVFAALAFAIIITREMSLRQKAERELQGINADLEIKVKERTQEVINKEEQYRVTLDNMLEGAQIIGFDWKYLYLNDAVVRQGKQDRQALLGKTMMKAYPGIEKTELFGSMVRCMSERKPQHLENRFVYPDGTVSWFELSIQPVKEGIFILSIDITKRKQAEEELARLNAELEQKVEERTSQLAAVNRELESFSYSVSHDLRAPLRALSGYAQMLREDYEKKLDAEGFRILDRIKYNAEKMGILIDELLSFSRLGRKDIQKSEVDLNELLEGVLLDLGKSTQHHASIRYGKLHTAYADYGLLHQAVFNLVSNAVKYSSKNPEPVVTIRTEEKNGEIVFHVADNGVGFNMKYYDKLFGVFQRLHSSDEFEGTGVGLAIVQRIITRHGGRVWAAGKPGEGAVFSFSLPIET